MRPIGATAILVLAGAVPALGAELPSRKPGLWELKTTFENRNGASPVMQACIDARPTR